MPPAVKRQRPTVKSSIAPPKEQATTSISKFTHVSKSIGSNGLEKDVHSRTTCATNTKASALAPSTRKRKAVATVQEESDSSADEAVNLSPPTPKQSSERDILPAKRGRGRPSKKSRATPASLKRGRSPSVSVSESDESTINTDKLFKRLRLESSPSRASSPLTAYTSTTESDADFELGIPSPPSLPSEILDLVHLHAAFLKTLTLHYAHNGSHVPADLRVLRPNVARAWGKKAVCEMDIRTCLGVLNMKTMQPRFFLSNYGRGKVCIEIDETQSCGPLAEKELNDIFRSNIETLWSHFHQQSSTSKIDSFVDSLPKASITICDSVAKASTVIAKGQQRLAELKQGMAAKKLEKDTRVTTAPASTPAQSPLTNPDGSKMSLLDRIRFKQLQKASLPAGLSAAEMERRAALQRVDEVAALIGMLSRASSTGMGRVSFPMPVMLQKLKDSFRMGISKEEGATCVRLIAKEIAPEWVVVVTINGKENVVVETDRQLSKVDVAKRVQSITASN
ncbi:hypothetical protein BKA67DRAFT_561315 [Truncatella angustata]|uniref:DNA replication factor Cdt1 C-terminal domain-containing protein n=1 Tax=Truncatella angustata TaxID=152316 RepID=A0A9P9A036_9PEZI|nr:uncharacterized protein BKA67DRAFT_561315 [Truncatella angustata]KAH6655629.1 hypothetical protein BKA67DRAFT_561315 [Truncatella angustata]KAH8200826.1 hypothetical protein TruAng_004985 [Truncatella angustata]